MIAPKTQSLRSYFYFFRHFRIFCHCECNEAIPNKIIAVVTLPHNDNANITSVSGEASALNCLQAQLGHFLAIFAVRNIPVVTSFFSPPPCFNASSMSAEKKFRASVTLSQNK